jgi:hypothetical protein
MFGDDCYKKGAMPGDDARESLNTAGVHLFIPDSMESLYCWLVVTCRRHSLCESFSTCTEALQYAGIIKYRRSQSAICQTTLCKCLLGVRYLVKWTKHNISSHKICQHLSFLVQHSCSWPFCFEFGFFHLACQFRYFDEGINVLY